MRNTLVAGAVALAPLEIAVGAVALASGPGAAMSGVAGTVISGVFTRILSSSHDPSVNKVVSVADRRRLEEKYGIDLENGRFYLTHPKRQDYLIPADRFYDHIINEQAADIMSMIKALVPAKEITIQINADEPVEIAVSNQKSGSDFSFRRVKSTSLQIKAEFGGIVIDDGRSIVWQDLVPVVQRALSDRTLKSLTFSHKNDVSFGLSLNLMKNIGVSLKASHTQYYGVAMKC